MSRVSDPRLIVIPDRCSLYQQARSSRYYCRIKLDDGGWHRVATGETELERAKERALELYYEARAKGKNNLPTNSRTFSSVAKTIVDKLEKLKKTPEWKQTYQSYIYAINKYQIPYFGHTKLDNIREKYSSYIDHVSKELGRTPTQSTIANHHGALKLILDEAVTRGWANNSTLPVLKSVGKQSTRRPSFEIREYDHLVQLLRKWCAQKTHRKIDAEIRTMLYDYVLILANSGIRHGREAMDILWANISFEKTAKGNEVVTINVVKRKGRRATAENRKVVVRHNEISNFKKILERMKNRDPNLIDVPLDKLIKERRQIHLFRLSDNSQPKRLDGTFKKFMIDSGMLLGAEGTARTLYSFRHFYATQELLREPPITIHLLAKQMGTSVKMIEKHYGHTEPFQKADRLSGWRDLGDVVTETKPVEKKSQPNRKTTKSKEVVKS